MPNTQNADEFNPYSPEGTTASDAPPPEDTSTTPRNPDGTFAKRDTPEGDSTPRPSGNVTPALRRQAKQLLGLEDEDIEGWSKSELQRELLFHKQMDRMERMGRYEQGGGRATQAAPAESAVAELSADSTDYETLVGTVNDLRSRLAAIENAAQHVPKMAQFIERQEQREQLDLADELDNFFSEHPDTFGDGDWKEVDRDSPDFFCREFVAKAALKATRGQTRGLRKALERVYAERFGGARPRTPPARNGPPPPDAGEDETDRRYAAGRGVLGRPTSRAGAPASGYEAALAGTEAILNRANLRGGRGNSVIPGTLDGLPE